MNMSWLWSPLKLRWAIAVLSSVLMAALAASLSPAADTFMRAMWNGAFALFLVLVQPWRNLILVSRLLNRVLPGTRKQAGSTTRLFQNSAQQEWLGRDVLFRGYGWLSGFCLGLLVGQSVQVFLSRSLVESRFENMATPVELLAGVMVGGLIALWFDRLPRLAATWRFDGRVDAYASSRVIEHGTGALLVLAALGLFSLSPLFSREALTPYVDLLFGSQLRSFEGSVFEIVVVALAATIGFAIPWLAWSRTDRPHRTLWLFVGNDNGLSAEPGHMPGLAVKFVDRLMSVWDDGPMVVALPPSIEVGGEQQHAALTLHRERVLYPQIPIELGDWAQLSPLPERWRASPIREIHLVTTMMIQALDRLAQPGDRVLLLGHDEKSLALWRERLRRFNGLVVQVDNEPAHGLGDVLLRDLMTSDAALIHSLGIGTSSKADSDLAAAKLATPEIAQTLSLTPVPAIAAPPATSASESPAPASESPPYSEKPKEVPPLQTLVDIPISDPPPDVVPSESKIRLCILAHPEYHDIVLLLVHELVYLGYEVDDARDRGPQTFMRSLRYADAAIAVVGGLTAQSEWSTAEISIVMKQKKPVIPVAVDFFDEPSSLKALSFANIRGDSSIDYLRDYADDRTGLKEAVSRAVERIVAAIPPHRSETSPSPRSPQPAPDRDTQAPRQVEIHINEASAGELSFSLPDELAHFRIAYRLALVESLLTEVFEARTEVDVPLRGLARLLIPEQFQVWFETVPSDSSLRLHLTEQTARFPWELLFAGLSMNTAAPIAPRLLITRQIAGLQLPSNVSRSTSATALLIANPSTANSERALGLPARLPDLPGAEHEAGTIGKLLEVAGFSVSRAIGSDATARNVISTLLAEDYRLVLVAAHALYNHAHRDQLITGVPLSDGVLLTGAEFRAMSAIPDLVFLNTEWLGRMGQGSWDKVVGRSLVVDLLSAGVRCVIASTSALDDMAAADFSEDFFSALLNGDSAERALMNARARSMRSSNSQRSMLWASYQLYGDAEYRLPLPINLDPEYPQHL